MINGYKMHVFEHRKLALQKNNEVGGWGGGEGGGVGVRYFQIITRSTKSGNRNRRFL